MFNFILIFRYDLQKFPNATTCTDYWHTLISDKHAVTIRDSYKYKFNKIKNKQRLHGLRGSARWHINHL